MTEKEEMLMQLVSTQKRHIDTYKAILRAIRRELDLMYEPYLLKNIQKMKDISNEVQQFITDILEEEDK